MDWTYLRDEAAEYVIALVYVALLVYVLPWINAKVASIKDQHARQIVAALVAAAEQKFGAQAGPAKFAWVIDQGEKRGLDLQEADVEAAVYGLRGGASQ